MKQISINSKKFSINLYSGCIILVAAFFLFLSSCREVAKPQVETKNIFLPTESQITQVLQSKEDYKMLDDHARSRGETNAKEYHAKLASDISDEELQPYYNKYKPTGMENLGVEAISRERKKILDRLVWYKIVQEVNLKVEMKELEFKKVDWKKISFDEEPTIGNQFAKITVFEFSDFECHYCSKSQADSIALREKYGKKIFWVFKDFPLQEIHEDAFQAHISANCVLEVQPEKYWSHFKTLFDNYKSLQKDNLVSFIQDNGINEEKWKACMKDPELQKQIIAEIQEDLKEGKKMGIKGTPTFIINGKLIVGARGFDFFDSIIEKELKAAK
ncbi:MAG TPA: thioredoxin domain-containing protein [Leptospiraceae bacterium]|nr:thioredoxin domain-containing protein [Leptospiraceae bacterium]